MRIVTRPDFDGIVCAVLLKTALKTDRNLAIHWVEPNEIQSGTAQIKTGDILANLPYSPNCSLWFDHHISNKPDFPVNGAFYVAPSAAGVIYKYYREKGLLDNRYDELIEHTDMIDAADLNRDQVRFPEKYPYILLSMTIKNDHFKDSSYWNHLVDLLMAHPIDHIMETDDVKQRSNRVIQENDAWTTLLQQHTRIVNHISITDFRSRDVVPNGNRFLTYCIYPDSIASVKIRYASTARQAVQVSVGKSIFNRQCRVNIGKLLSGFGGGGHDGAGGCTLDAVTADADIEQILGTLYANKAAT